MMLVARLQIGQPTIGDDWLILSFAAPVIGGALLPGGHVSVVGTFLGVVIIAIITQALVLFAHRPVRRAGRARRADPLGRRHQPLARGPAAERPQEDWHEPSTRFEARGVTKSFPGVRAL